MILLLILSEDNNIFFKEHQRLIESGVDEELVYSATSTLMLEILGKVHN